MARLVLLVVALLLVVSCEPLSENAQPKYPPQSMVGRRKEPPKVDENVVTSENCKEEDGFQLKHGVCVEKKVKPKPQEPVVGTECQKDDFSDCKLQCERGNAASCWKLGLMYDKGTGGANKNLALAAQFFSKACDSGELRACAKMAIAYYEGNGVEKDFTKAAGLFQRLCDQGLMSGCAMLGALYAEGKGVAQDTSRAISLITKACDGNEFDACAVLGSMYFNGTGVGKDLKRASAYFTKACDGGSKEGCAAIARQKVVGQSKNWRVMRSSEFIKYAEKIATLLIARDPSLALSGFVVLPAMMSPTLTSAQKEYAMCEFYANVFFADDVAVVDGKFRVSPNFLIMYKNAVPALAKMKAACIQNCLASDVRATRDACDAICEKNPNP